MIYLKKFLTKLWQEDLNDLCSKKYQYNIVKKGQISSQNVSFYLRIQYLRSKIAGRIYRE